MRGLANNFDARIQELEVEQAKKLNIKMENTARYSKTESRRAFAKMASDMNDYIRAKQEGRIKDTFIIKKDSSKEDLL